jgi:hypothetical protein
MDIEHEAAMHIQKKEQTFNVMLADRVAQVEAFLLSHLHDTAERDKALDSLTEASLWAKHCLSRYGAK